MRCGNNKLDVARWLATVALGFVIPRILGCPLLFDPACISSHLGEDPRSYPDFDSKLGELRAAAEATNCGCVDGSGGYYYLLVGTCGESSIRFISEGDGFTGTAYYYRTNGDFLALSDFRDFPLPPCFGSTDWPRKVACDDFEWTETICELGECPANEALQPIATR